jgi:hypothetical protein
MGAEEDVWVHDRDNPQKDAIVEIASVDLRAGGTISNRHLAWLAPGNPHAGGA